MRARHGLFGWGGSRFARARSTASLWRVVQRVQVHGPFMARARHGLFEGARVRVGLFPHAATAS